MNFSIRVSLRKKLVTSLDGPDGIRVDVLRSASSFSMLRTQISTRWYVHHRNHVARYEGELPARSLLTCKRRLRLNYHRSRYCPGTGISNCQLMLRKFPSTVRSSAQTGKCQQTCSFTILIPYSGAGDL